MRLWQIPRWWTIIVLILVWLAFLVAEVNLLFWGTPEEFQRFGSAIVAAGVIAVGISQAGITHAEELHQDRQEMGASANGQHKAEAASHRFFVRFNLIVEFGVIVLGTLQWGYGDLLVTYLRTDI